MNSRESDDQDIGVALIFFNRPDVLVKTFEAIAEMRPKKLFLIQDGPRNNADLSQVLECRAIVENINWPCTVQRNFSEVNLGCGARIFTGLSWAFTQAEKLIILEDDCVPAHEFYDFCCSLLNKYEHDERIDMICGMNHLDVHDRISSDYFFCRTGSIWGWATWKRVWQSVDYKLEFLEDEYAVRMIRKIAGSRTVRRGKLLKEKLERNEKLSEWSYPRGINAVLHNGLSIVPRANMIKNIGLTVDSANTSGSIKYIPHGLKRIYKLNFHRHSKIMVHPRYIIPDLEYDTQVTRIMGNSNQIQFFMRRLEAVFL